MEQFWDAYPIDVRKFAFQFHSVLNRDYEQSITVIDDFMVDHLKFFVDNGHFSDTLIILMTDHGRRSDDIRATQQDQLEKRLPFVSFAFPPWFKKKYPKSINVFKENARRLTTPRDIHATLKVILNFDSNPKTGDLKKKSLSLFHEIPTERTCANAGIESRWCACLEWIEVPIE